VIYLHVTAPTAGELWTCRVDRHDDEGVETTTVRVEHGHLAVAGVRWQDERLVPPKGLDEDPKAFKGFRALATAAQQQAARGGCAAGALYLLAEGWSRSAQQASFASMSQRMAANAAVARDLASLLEDAPDLSAAGLAAGFRRVELGANRDRSMRRVIFRASTERLWGGVEPAPGEALLIWAFMLAGAQKQLASTATTDHARHARWTELDESLVEEWSSLRELDAEQAPGALAP
jgi:hypothetical protein